MSEVTTLLAWLIPVIVIIIAIIAWRVYIYKTQGPILPSYLQRNVFARTSSLIPRTFSFSSNKGVSTTDGDARQHSTAPALVVRNETQPVMAKAPVPLNNSGQLQSQSKPVSSSISRLVEMN